MSRENLETTRRAIEAFIYERWGFEPSPTDARNLQMLFKDFRKSLES